MFKNCRRFISGAELKEVMADLDEHLSQEEVPCQKIYVTIIMFFRDDDYLVIDH